MLRVKTSPRVARSVTRFVTHQESARLEPVCVRPREGQWYWLPVILCTLAVASAQDHLVAWSDWSQTSEKTQTLKTEERQKAGAPGHPELLRIPSPAPVRAGLLPVALSKPSPTSLEDLRSIEKNVETLVARVSPAVVAVEVGNSSGSGVIISDDGLVLTAGHVCGQPNRDVRFTFPDGKKVRGKTLGLDEDADTGLMKITDPGVWPHVPVGDLQQAHVGDWVLALGNPGGFDLGRSLVIRLGRLIRITPEALQTDCPISPGDSGGALVDMYGRVIGIHSAISVSVAENFHVPITEFYDTWAQLSERAKVEAPSVTVSAYAGATGVDAAGGCRVSAVDKRGPAARAGLRVGDMVMRVEGREIPAAATFRRWIAEARPGETLNLEVRRGNNTIRLKLQLDAAPASR
jgi:serine protease Do